MGAADPDVSQAPAPDEGLGADLWMRGNNWSEAWRKRRPDPPELLFHYTDAAGALRIIGSKTLWASDAAFLNDSTEVVYIRRILAHVTAELYDVYEIQIVRDYLVALETAFQRTLVKSFEVFVACFCEESDLLSQWRGYPQAGGGYALGFHSQTLSQRRMLEKIIYEADMQRDVVRDLLKPSCDLLAASFDHEASEYLVKCQRLAIDMTAANLAEVAFCFKHPGFKEEA